MNRFQILKLTDEQRAVLEAAEEKARQATPGYMAQTVHWAKEDDNQVIRDMVINQTVNPRRWARDHGEHQATARDHEGHPMHPQVIEVGRGRAVLWEDATPDQRRNWELATHRLGWYGNPPSNSNFTL
jgi:hypothetical protein